MTPETREPMEKYFEQAGSWSEDRLQSIQSSRRIAWIVALIAATLAIIEAVIIAVMLPLKTVVPHTLLVDRQTGFVQALDPAKPQKIAADQALTQSFLVQYVEAREAFDIATIQYQFRKVALWSGGEAKSRYVASMQATNPQSPLATLPRTTTIDVQVRSVSPLSQNSALVRFASIRRDYGANDQPAQNWVAVIRYRYTNAPMAAEDRFINPLGFEVTEYRKDAEVLPAEPQPQTASSPQSSNTQTPPVQNAVRPNGGVVR